MKSFAHSFTRPLLMLIGLMLLSFSGFYLTAPTPVAAATCIYYVNNTPFYTNGNAQTLNVAVLAHGLNSPTCSWTAKANSSWISVVSGTSGKSSGNVVFKIEANPNNFTRNGTLTIAGKIVYVYQNAACNYVVTSTQQNAPAQGGKLWVNLSVAQGCNWTFQSNVTWMHPSAIVGNQGGAISFDVDPNPGGIRTGTLTLAGKTITVTQQPTCSYALTPTSQSVPGTGGAYSAQLTAPAGCHWNAATDSGAWVKFNGNTTGTGSATISYNVLANPEDFTRTAYIIVANKQLTISQAKGQPAPPQPTCTYNITPTSHSATAAGGQFNLSITKGNNCALSVSSQSPWIKLSNVFSGDANYSATVTIDPNSSAARNGQIALTTSNGPAAVNVTQAAGAPACQGLNLSPSAGQIKWLVGLPYSLNFTANSGTAPFTFTLFSGTLPTGLQLNANGTLSGTPTVPGTSNFVVKAQDVNGCVGYSTLSMLISDCPAGGCATLLATPDPLLLCNGATTGVVTLNWSAPAGVNQVQLHVESPTGPLLKTGGATGSYTSGNWAQNGTKFFLIDPTTYVPLAYHEVKATSNGCNGGSGTLTASPNPIAVCDGSGLGVTTLSWNATGVTNVEVRAGAPNGTLIASGGATGNFTTGKMVTNGMVFYLMDANANYVLATTTVNHTQQGCGGGGGTLTVTTNPIQVCDGSGMGIATLEWSAPGYNVVQLRVGSPNGAVFATGSEIGSAITGKWVTDGMQIFLVDGETLATLASTTINVTTQGCPPSSGSGTGTIKATPNPIKACDGSGFGMTRIEWTYTAGIPVEVRVGNPNGVIIGQGTGSGVVFTGKWVSNGLMFYLVETATGNVVAQVKATVTNWGCK